MSALNYLLRKGYSYDEVINEYHSFIEAARTKDVMRGTHIGDVVRGKRKTAYGYKWRIKE